MRYSISHWSGRLGNNIQQIANAIMIAENRGHTFEQCIDHDIISKFTLSYGIDGQKISKTFYNWGPLFCCHNNTLIGKNELGISKEHIYKNIRRICREHIFPNLKVPQIKTFDENTVVIHIRAGEIFAHQHETPHNYVQNPLAYYLVLIKTYENVIVVTEAQNNNPVISELKKIKKIKFQSLKVAEDYATLLAAQNLATSGVGTFGISAALCSRNIKNLFASDIFLPEHLNYTMMYNTDVTVHEIKLKNYIPLYPCSWKNNIEQRELMLKYQLDSDLKI
jgi:hypothetical protein